MLISRKVAIRKFSVKIFWNRIQTGRGKVSSEVRNIFLKDIVPFTTKVPYKLSLITNMYIWNVQNVVLNKSYTFFW